MATVFESAIGDIIDVISAVSDIAKESDSGVVANLISKKFGKRNQFKGSITSQANNLIMTFPVLMSNTISPHTALMLSKAIERKCVVMLQMLFASDALISAAGEGGVRDVIQQYYTGIDFKTMTVDDVMKVMEKLDLTESQKTELTFAINDAKKILEQTNIMALNMPVYESNINEDALSSFSMNGDTVIQEAKGKSGSAPKSIIPDAPDLSDYDKIQKRIENLSKDIRANRKYHGNADERAAARKADIDAMNANIAYAKTMLDRRNANIEWDQMTKQERQQNLENLLKITKAAVDRKELTLAMNKDAREQERVAREVIMHNLQVDQMWGQIVGQRVDFMKKQLLDSDVKKANEMVPSMLIVDFKVEGGPELIKGTGIVGIKTRIVPVDSAEIVDRIASKSKSRAGLVNLIRATTGETKFMKDFVLNVDRAKVDAIARSHKGSVSPMWRVLERRATKQSIRKALAQRNDASPITTLVITEEEVEYLKKTQAIDLNNVAVANDMLEAYNLMGLCIVDEAAEVVKCLWDGEMTAFEPVSFLAMEKEDSNNGGMYKKVINLLAQNR